MSLTTSLQLTPEQKGSFVRQGFLRFPQLLTSELVEKLRQATNNLADLNGHLPQAAVIEGEDGEQHVIGIEKIASLTEPVFRELLGSPLLLSIAQEICGKDFFPVQDFIVIKTVGDGNEVKWHQDILTKPLGKSIMIGFYLDPTNDLNGALRVIPGSHKSGLPICELEKMEYTSIEMEAGDVLVHDLMLAHSSGKLTDFKQRRVVYVEFMSANQASSECIYAQEFVEVRAELIALAIQCYGLAHPDETLFIPEQCKPFSAVENPLERMKELYEVRRGSHVANYCFDQIRM